MNKFINPTEIELQDETVVAINKISKATTGGRRMRFNSIVCVGDGKCHVGIGFGKANEVASAVNKAKENALSDRTHRFLHGNEVLAVSNSQVSVRAA